MSVELKEFEQTAAASASPGQKIILVQFPFAWGRNVSPFCLKLEAWLRLADIPYMWRGSLNLRSAPNRKFPYIIDGKNKIADSAAVIRHLKQTRNIDPDAGLDDYSRCQARLLQRMFEQHLYFVMLYSRWIDPPGWSEFRREFFRAVPAMVRPMIGTVARREVRSALHHQGLGRLSSQEIYRQGREDLEAIACHLDDRSFFLGDRLTTIDAIAYGFLANILHVPIETPLKRDAQRFDNLSAWCDAMENGLAAES